MVNYNYPQNGTPPPNTPIQSNENEALNMRDETRGQQTLEDVVSAYMLPLAALAITERNYNADGILVQTQSLDPNPEDPCGVFLVGKVSYDPEGDPLMGSLDKANVATVASYLSGEFPGVSALDITLLGRKDGFYYSAAAPDGVLMAALPTQIPEFPSLVIADPSDQAHSQDHVFQPDRVSLQAVQNPGRSPDYPAASLEDPPGNDGLIAFSLTLLSRYPIHQLPPEALMTIAQAFLLTSGEQPRFLSLRKSAEMLTTALGGGWSRSNLKRKIVRGEPFEWRHGVHFIDKAGVLQVNPDAVLDSLDAHYHDAQND